MRATVIGDSDMVTGFQLVGINGVKVSSIDEAQHTLLKAVEDIDVAVVIIGEDFSNRMRNTIDEIRLNQIAPLIIELPGPHGPTGTIDISRIVRRSVGVQV
jgi:vacuolar-type H+-ATPase subunit F/Vma7